MAKPTPDQLVAAAYGDASRVAKLLRAGADPNATGTNPPTTARRRVGSGQRGRRPPLLEAGADPNLESLGDDTEGTPLCAAASWGYTDVVRVLLAHGADPDLAEGGPVPATPLIWAAAKGTWTRCVPCRRGCGSGGRRERRHPGRRCFRRGHEGVARVLRESRSG